MTTYGRSPWIEQFPKSRVPAYPRYRQDFKTEVVIVGGGMTGCATAYAFSTAGVDVVLLEAGQIGRDAAGTSAGWIGDDPGVSFGSLEKSLGLRAARRAWQAWHRAGLDFAALLRRLRVKCSLESHGSVTVAINGDEAASLKREQKFRLDAGLEAPLLTARTLAAEAGLSAALGLRAYGGATLDPYRAALGLAAEAVKRGARCFERSPVTRIRFGRRNVDVSTATGSIRASRVVIATGTPTLLFKALQRHFWFRHTYLALTDSIPSKIRQRLGQRTAVVRDSANPPHVVRWVGGDRLLVMGADLPSPPPRLRDKTIVQRTGQLMYELSTLYPDISGVQPAWGWDTPFARTAHGLPCIGPHRNYPHHLFAFGNASHSATGAYLASRILLRQHLGQMDPTDEAFAFRL